MRTNGLERVEWRGDVQLEHVRAGGLKIGELRHGACARGGDDFVAALQGDEGHQAAEAGSVMESVDRAREPVCWK
ncbi:hypothetical protein HWV62_9357 [Athelia sp. TMB]|nr:hypothetical protein HWV62_9357 [Athelia sp. TMB]